MAIDTIKSVAIFDGSVATADIADDAVTNAKIGADAVGTTELANDVAISTSGTISTSNNLSVTGTGNIGSALTMSGNDFANHIQMNNGGTGGTTFSIFSTSDAYAQPSANWMLHHSSAGNGIILADQNGRVRMPYQPMFALKNTGNSTHYKQASVQINQGSHWDNVSGRFTAPIAGRYLIGYHANSKSIICKFIN